MARKLRLINRVNFNAIELTQIVAYMSQLADAGDGWINLIPKISDGAEKSTSLGFFTLFGGGGTGVTMCTWIPGSHDQTGRNRPSLGITHVTGHRAVGQLLTLGVSIPESWLVEQDHPRRGLVLRIPPTETPERVLAWALQAMAGLMTGGPVRGWRADIYLPLMS